MVLFNCIGRAWMLLYSVFSSLVIVCFSTTLSRRLSCSVPLLDGNAVVTVKEKGPGCTNHTSFSCLFFPSSSPFGARATRRWPGTWWGDSRPLILVWGARPEAQLNKNGLSPFPAFASKNASSLAPRSATQHSASSSADSSLLPAASSPDKKVVATDVAAVAPDFSAACRNCSNVLAWGLGVMLPPKCMSNPNTQKSTWTMPAKGGPVMASVAAISTEMRIVTNHRSME
ncbi:hypothetical protein B0T26DRAFT_200310 [Lasiosphaeria miniovina]|uniref:Uncharacterized protein n=1 Tax=Lasiosphaeria miniovina TaxID=1954250 RepID=A0AA40AU44_9PEZI|nr:uncharacterized protein B0T26DRAFT_200310 [Lasiosphaeria miniovina]KAK0722053.1 hypothetical protein B0T26DRAFT_200310 [Lasiosphaeria miniovina]